MCRASCLAACLPLPPVQGSCAVGRGRTEPCKTEPPRSQAVVSLRCVAFLFFFFFSRETFNLAVPGAEIEKETNGASHRHKIRRGEGNGRVVAAMHLCTAISRGKQDRCEEGKGAAEGRRPCMKNRGPSGDIGGRTGAGPVSFVWRRWQSRKSWWFGVRPEARCATPSVVRRFNT